MDARDAGWLLPGPNNVHYLGAALTSRMVAAQHRGGTDQTPIDQVFAPLEVTEAKTICRVILDHLKKEDKEITEEVILDLMTTAFFAGTQTMYIATVGGLDRLRMEEIMREEAPEEDSEESEIDQRINDILQEGGSSEDVIAHVFGEDSGATLIYEGDDPEEAMRALMAKLNELHRKRKEEDGTKDS